MNGLTKITPVPQKLCPGSGKVILGSLSDACFRIACDACGVLAQEALAYLKKELSAKMDTCADCAQGDIVIQLTVSDAVPAEVTKNTDQAYAVSVSDNGIVLTGYGEAGLYYAVTTLLQIIEIENGVVSVPKMELLDWPDLKTRGHFMECRYASNLMTLEDWKALVDDMAGMKLNQLVVALYGCWCVQYDGIISEYVYVPIPKYPLIKNGVIKRYYSPKKKAWINEEVDVPMVKEDFFGDLIAYGKTRGVEVLPLWNSYGHNTLIPRLYPEVSAIVDGKPAGHGYCVSNPKTYEMLYDIFDHIIDSYLKPNGIESFHIGMDEVRNELATDVNDIFRSISPWCECPECSKFTNEEKFINHAIKLISYLKSRGMKNVYIYSDMMTHIINPAKFQKLLVENNLMDVTVIDWWTYTNHKERQMFQTMHPELGIRATIKPWNSYYHWNMTFNTVPNVQLLCDLASKEENAEGLQSYSAWDRVCDRNHVSMADYSWNYTGTGTVAEYNDRYALRAFGDRWEEARRGFELIDMLTDDRHGVGIPEGEEALGNGTILQHTMAYYFFSYVHVGDPYPRNYPGEAVSRMLANRPMYDARLREIVEMSREALAIFDSLASYADCDTDLARRYACEVANYLSLAEDFQALLEIYDIMEKPERSAAVSAKIAGIAKERKENRLSLMLKMEMVKEDFLIPSHLRNQSIYMMVFADIESYVNTTAPDALQLDVSDLSPIGSKAFYKLR